MKRFLAAAWTGTVLYGLVGLLSVAGVLSGRNEGIHRIHDLASVISLGLLAGVGFGAQIRGAWRSAALAQLAVVVAVVSAIYYGIPLAAEGQIVGLLVLVVVVLAPAVVVLLLHPDRDRIRWWTGAPSVPLLALGVAGLVASAPYAFAQLNEQIVAPAGDAHKAEFHYAGMSALAMSLAFGGIVAALKTDGWRTAGRVVGAGTILFGVASIFLPELVSSLGTTFGATAIGLGALYWILLEREGRRP